MKEGALLIFPIIMRDFIGNIFYKGLKLYFILSELKTYLILI